MWVYWRIIALGLAWWGVLLGTLQITHLPGNWGHGICGPWGCGPPLQALVACHGFWFVLAAPLVAIPVRFWSARWLRTLGITLLVAGLFGLTGVAVWQAIDYLPAVREGQPSYFVQRYLFVLATLVEVPIVPVTLAGALCWRVGAKRRARTRPVTDSDSATEQTASIM